MEHDETKSIPSSRVVGRQTDPPQKEDHSNTYAATLKLCVNLIGLRDAALASLARAVAEDAHKLALKLGLDAANAQDVMVAGLLHPMGKLALSDVLLNKPFNRLTPAERIEVDQYPVIGAKLLAGIEPLRQVAQFIRHQNEHFNGHGMPDHLVGEAIPLGARILSIAKGYYAYNRGRVDGHWHTPEEASEFLQRNRRTRYDPEILDTFLDIVRTSTKRVLNEPVLCVTTENLSPGMVLARDLLSDEGALLLAKDYILDDVIIKQLKVVEYNTGEQLTVFVWHNRKPGRAKSNVHDSV